MTEQAKNVWSKAARTSFNTHKPTLAEISAKAADNILIAWPPILRFLKGNLRPQGNSSLHALDYGCGTGGFAQELHDRLGVRVTGMDYARGMIDIAREHVSSDVAFEVGDHTAINKIARYDLITSIMTLQFLPELDIEQVFQTFSQTINNGGLLAIAVFNPEWVKVCLSKGVLFSDFDSSDTPRVGMLEVAEEKIPVFIRNSSDYDKLAKANGFTKMLEDYPEFTADFLSLYPSTDQPTDISEFLIMGFKKLNRNLKISTRG